jgi:hypothetical protein
MAHRVIKQTAYGIVFLVFLAVITFGIKAIFFKTVPTCFDNIQNQDEEGIDCGGSCSGFCDSNLYPLQSSVSIAIGSDPKVLELYASVRNRNQDFAVRDFSYVFTIFNKSGDKMKAVGQSYIYSGETKDILGFAPVDDNFSASQIDRVEFAIDSPVDWVPADSFAKPRFSIQNFTVDTSEGRVIIKGRVANQDSLTFPSLKVYALFQGQFGQITGISQTEISRIAPGEARDFTITHPLIPDFNPSDVTVSYTALHP